jgi:hypothetical protein
MARGGWEAGESRRPKSEGRKKAENRSPKGEAASVGLAARRESQLLRVSDFGLLSAFGFRSSDFPRIALYYFAGIPPGPAGNALVNTSLINGRGSFRTTGAYPIEGAGRGVPPATVKRRV